MALSWNEIKDRAVAFSKEWEDTFNEEAEAKPFLEAFFNIFGITRKRVGTFEHRVKKLSEADGYIDLLWKGMILIEMKTKGKNLDKAFIQAKEYIHGIKEHELPKYILVSDFENFRLFDTEENTTIAFKLKDLVNNVQHFGFIAGYQKRIYKEQDQVNIKAAELMGKLHDRLKEIGYEGHPLEVYLVRLLFCLFAEDTTIFERQQFQNYIEERTNEDGSDLASKIQELFQTLNTPNDKRFKNLDEQLNAFPYVNGKLFEEVLPSASFDTAMRKSLLECCYIDWSKISPAIFGSMFQSVMNPKERRNLGAHYTSEKNILKLIKPLFLDDLWREFESAKNNKNKLLDFHKKLSSLKFLDPACGCGNFLVITYREIRLLELQVIKQRLKIEGFREEVSKQALMSVSYLVQCDVDMMYGIEYEEFPVRIAEVAMWLIDHQMNMLISNEFGQYFVRLPLKKSANILHDNALRVDWNTVIKKHHLSYILGNPPFIGKQVQNNEQKKDMENIFIGVKGSGTLDYVSAWYLKAASYIENSRIRVAFVSTNSITQGEQTGLIWGLLFKKYNIKIHFAHRTFKWGNEAKGNAAVHVVIIGFANYDINEKVIFDYEHLIGEAHELKVKNINPYLVEGKDVFVTSRTTPLCNVPEIIKGSETTDDGHFMLTVEEVEFLETNYPLSKTFIRPFLGGGDFLNGKTRYCLWLKDAPLNELRKIPFVLDRIERVRSFREASNKTRTRHWANFPTLFSEDRQPKTKYLMFPKVSSERRNYIPFAYVEPNFIINNTASFIPEASLLLFGILESKMHMTWMSSVCGRMKSDYVYSNKIVYNNFPFPLSLNEKQKNNIEQRAEIVLKIRTDYPTYTLAELYDPTIMPPKLLAAHLDLDKAVDLAYRAQPFINDGKRMEFLFELYEGYISNLFSKVKPKKNNK
jgi:N-6 DNA Methylase